MSLKTYDGKWATEGQIARALVAERADVDIGHDELIASAIAQCLHVARYEFGSWQGAWDARWAADVAAEGVEIYLEEVAAAREARKAEAEAARKAEEG